MTAMDPVPANTNASFTAYSVEMFAFERDFDQAAFYKWIVKCWTHSIWYSMAYVFLVFYGKHYMSKREPFDLRLPLIIWSSILAVFSIFGAVRTVPELVYIISQYGFESSVCNPSYLYGSVGFWVYIFTISKLYELGDTAFVVLRKQKLMFLHWYHHITVFIYAWVSYTEATAPGRWFMVMNFTVHSFMYTYYALRAMRFRIPKQVNIFITMMQISQMIMGLLVTVKAYQYQNLGHFCVQSQENMRYTFIMYGSYLLLFSNFFYKSYVMPKSSTTTGNKKPVQQGNEQNREMLTNGLAKKME